MELDENEGPQKNATFDEQAMAQFFKPIEVRVKKYIGFRVQDKTDAKDVFQETFLGLTKTLQRKAVEKSPVRSLEHLMNLALAIASNKIINHFRRKGRSIETHSEAIDQIIDERVAYELFKNERIRMYEAIKQLPEIDQKIIYFRLDKKKFSEIAKALRMTETAVKTKHRRAIKKLRDLLGPETLS